MKRETTNYFAVGLFVLAALGVLFFALYNLISGSGNRDVYYIHYHKVRYLGIAVIRTFFGT